MSACLTSSPLCRQFAWWECSMSWPWLYCRRWLSGLPCLWKWLQTQCTLNVRNKEKFANSINLTVIASVCSTDGWRVLSSLSWTVKNILILYANKYLIPTCWSERIWASTRSFSKTRHCLKVQPQLANVIRYLVNCVHTSTSGCGSIRAGISEKALVMKIRCRKE